MEITKSLLARMASIDREIAGKRYPNKETLSKFLEVSTKTIQRTIEYMKEEYEAPIEFDRKRKGFIYTEPGFRISPLKMNGADLFALAITDKVLEQYRNSPYAKHFRRFYSKIQNLFPSKVSIDSRELNNIISFQTGPIRQVNDNTMDVINNALRKNIRVKMLYFSAYRGLESEREINPYHLRNYSGDWYLIGYCHRNKDVRVFAVSRIKRITLMNKYFEEPEGFNINDYFKNSFGIFESDKIYNVKLKIMNESVLYVREKQWHKSQKITSLKDGSIILEMSLNSLSEVILWILSLGKDCKVLEPKELKEIILKELQGAINNYE